MDIQKHFKVMRSKQSSLCFETTPNATQSQTLDSGSQRNHNTKESQANFLDIYFQGMYIPLSDLSSK